MSCIQITACQLHSSPTASPVSSARCSKASTISFTYLRTKAKLPKLSLNLTAATSRYHRAATVCLFGGKEKSGNGNEGSPWKALENVMGNFKKEQSVEDLLKQQIQKQEFYDDGGNAGKPPGGGSGGGGFGEAEEGGFAEIWNEFSQVFLATLGIVFLYIYLIEGEEINVLVKDLLKFVFKRQKSLRLQRLIEDCQEFFQSMKEQPSYDPYWLEREILNTTTMYDGPAKYNYILKTLEKLESRSDDRFVSTSSDDEQY